LFSIIGIVFLIIMGIIIDKQPIFVHGITNPHKSSVACFGGGTSAREGGREGEKKG